MVVYMQIWTLCVRKIFFSQLKNNIIIVESPARNEIVQNSLMASPPGG